MSALAHELARAIEHDLGLRQGLSYAERIARLAKAIGDTRNEADYAEAAQILRKNLEAPVPCHHRLGGDQPHRGRAVRKK